MKTTPEPLRIGAVNYLNTKPLIYGFERHLPRADLRLDYPSRLADQLSAGELEVGLIPSVEFFQDPSYRVVSEACIGCRGPVWSVKLLSRVPAAEIKTLALDEGSRTSAALVQILLNERFGLRPQLSPLPLGSAPIESEADAILLIGDRAMHAPLAEFQEVWDLGEEWNRHTGLPFVFAMWTAREGADTSGVDAGLNAARDDGLRNLGAIADREAARLGLTHTECVHYLRDNLHFRLGAQEMRGLEHFYRLAQKLNLAPSGVDLGSDACEVTR